MHNAYMVSYINCMNDQLHILEPAGKVSSNPRNYCWYELMFFLQNIIVKNI
jgi:hypothetical protein